MLVIRLTRIGKKNQPSFRVVLAEKKKAVKGKFIEILGNYNPRQKVKNLKAERIKYWVSQGAQPSATMHNMLVSEGIITGAKVKAWRPKVKEKTAQPEVKKEAKAPVDVQEAAGESASKEETLATS